MTYFFVFKGDLASNKKSLLKEFSDCAIITELINTRFISMAKGNNAQQRNKKKPKKEKKAK